MPQSFFSKFCTNNDIVQMYFIQFSYETSKCKKVQAGNDQEMAQSDRNFHSINRGMGKIINETWVLIPRKHIVSRVSSYSPIGGHSVARKEL